MLPLRLLTLATILRSSQVLSLQSAFLFHHPTRPAKRHNIFIMSSTTTDASDLVSIDQLLDTLHSSAASSNLETYFNCFSSDGRFLGTDPSENWHVDDFRDYARPAFDSGKGWTYASVSRMVNIYDSDIACFDEQLTSARFGHARGTGTVRREGSTWKILQYHLTFPIPNAIAETVTDMVRSHYDQNK